MEKTRLEAFSDGVIAIIITIMVLELKVPHSSDWAALRPLLPVFLSYVLSFIYVAIYWNNHHHMMHTVKHVNGSVLWANLHLLFWLSLFPFVTGWVGENYFAALPLGLYGVVLLMAGAAYQILQRVIIASQGTQSLLKKAVGQDIKGKISVLGYLVGIAFTFITPWVSEVIYAGIALMWSVPDSRIERQLQDND